MKSQLSRHSLRHHLGVLAKALTQTPLLRYSLRHHLDVFALFCLDPLQATKIALDLKKHLVDRNLLEVKQVKAME